MESNGNSRLPQKLSSTTTTPPSPPPQILLQVRKLAEAAGAEMTPARVLIYAEELSGHPITAIESAIKRTIRAWDKPNMMPPIGEIVKHITEHYEEVRRQQAADTTRKLIAMSKSVPPGWNPDHRERLREAQRIYLQSCADGKWGPDRVERAKDLLRRLDVGEDVAAPGTIAEVLRKHFGAATRPMGELRENVEG